MALKALVCGQSSTLSLPKGLNLSHFSNQNSEKLEGLVTNHKHTLSTYQLSRTLEWPRTNYYNQRCTFHPWNSELSGTQDCRRRPKNPISYSTSTEMKIYHFNDQVRVFHFAFIHSFNRNLLINTWPVVYK